MSAVMSAPAPRSDAPINLEAAFEHAAQTEDSDPSTIVARIACGDRGAAAEMVERYEKSVRRALLRLIPNPADRDDLVQDVWIVAMTRIRRGELREPELLRAFLVGTARALAVNERRRSIRRATVPDSPAVEEYPDDSGGPAEAVERAQCRQLTVRAISSLRTKRYREVLLRSVANYDKSTTCADLGINAIQYSRLFYKAKDRLREVIRESTTPPYPPRRDPSRP
jgi:RNA polymerase sigma factor (sigma-70 family)